MKGVFSMLKKLNYELISSLLYILIGILFIVFRDQALGFAMTVAGALFLIFGVFDLLKNNWAGGAVSLVTGLSIIIFGWILTEIVILVFGILIALKGIVSLIDELRRSKKNIVDIVFASLTIVIGLMLAFGELISFMIAVAGVMLMFSGIVKLINASVKNEN
jgi:hypothetical protein